MKTNILKTILTIITVLVVLVFLVFVLKNGLDKSEKVRCLKLQAQATEFSQTYSAWAKENPKAHADDVKWCGEQYNVEIVLQ